MIAVIADCHVGNFKANGGPMLDGLNDRGRLTIETFRQAVVEARRQAVEVLYVAGDLFHSRRSDPAIVAAVLKVLVEEAADFGVVLIPGNHDMMDVSAAGGNTACEPLYQAASIANTPQVIGDVLVVPFQGGGPMSAHLELVLQPGEAKTLITHVGVYDDTAHPWCAAAPDAIHKDLLFALMANAGIDTAFVGNFHKSHCWSSTAPNGDLLRIIQCGTLCPHGHGDAGHYPQVGAMWIYGGGENLFPVEIPGPRFIADETERSMVLAGGADDPPGSFRVLATEPVSPKALQSITSADLPEAEDATGALATFVASHLPEGLELAEVQARVLELWATAAGNT